MRLALITVFTTAALQVYGQYFQFSQYNFTPQRVNPAMTGSSDYATASLLYRNQSTGGGFHLNSNIFNASYPLFSGKGKRWAGVGLSLMDDRAGQAGIFNTQEVAVTYAANVFLSKFQTLSLGIKGLYQHTKLDLAGLHTGSQYIPDRGFDESVPNGEHFGELKDNIGTFSAALYWLQTDKKGNRLADFGFSFFDLNRPQNSFLQGGSQLNTTFAAHGSVRIYQKDNVSAAPEILFTHSAAHSVINLGMVTSYSLQSYRRKPSDRIDIITKYVIGRSGIVGLQLHRENFSVGMSYDFPVARKNIANTGAFEIGAALRSLVKTRNKSKRKGNNGRERNSKAIADEVRAKTKEVPAAQERPVPLTDSVQTVRSKGDLGVRLKQKQDSLVARANAGEIRHQPIVLEKATLHFNFEFNSSAIDEGSSQFLQDLAEALIDNPELKINLVGHTDNVGSDKFNLKLSQVRAQAVKEYLINHGVEADRIHATGQGMREPLEDNTTEKGRARNRRVEMTIIYGH